MPRPTKCRLVRGLPEVDFFKPRGVPIRELEEVVISPEEVEALRLVDVQGLSHIEAGERMNISRQTFGRVLGRARRTVAQAVTGGLALRIGGGNYLVRGETSRLPRKKDRADREVRNMTKIAVSSQGPGLEDEVDARFGRAGGFVVVDLETMETQYVENGTAQVLPQGAGIQAAETVAGTGAGVVLTGYVGPKAFDALTALGIKVGQDVDGVTVGQALENYKAGLVEIAQAPNRTAGGRGGKGGGRGRGGRG